MMMASLRRTSSGLFCLAMSVTMEVEKMGYKVGAQGRMQQRGTEQFFARMFEQRDVNQDGKLSADEMPEQMSARLKQVDTDADGFVSRAEMKAMVSRLRGRSGGQQKARQATPGYESEDSNGNRPGGDLPRRPAVEVTRQPEGSNSPVQIMPVLSSQNISG